MQAAPLVNTSSNVVTTTTTRTETYKGANAGGEARKQAEVKGEQEVQRFEERVQKLIRRVGPCPCNARWYNSEKGYMCGGGTHMLYHKDIDMASRQPGWIPQATLVNTLGDPDVYATGTLHFAHPPQVAFHERMHSVHRAFMRLSRDMGFLLLEDLERLGCNDQCLGGLEAVSKEECEWDLRQRGFFPNASRHAMFR